MWRVYKELHDENDTREVLEDPTNLVSSFSRSISASFCFNERLRMLTSFLSASVERWTASRSALSFLFSIKKMHTFFERLLIQQKGFAALLYSSLNHLLTDVLQVLHVFKCCKFRLGHTRKCSPHPRPPRATRYPKTYLPTVSLEVSCCHSRFNRRWSCSCMTKQYRHKWTLVPMQYLTQQENDALFVYFGLNEFYLFYLSDIEDQNYQMTEQKSWQFWLKKGVGLTSCLRFHPHEKETIWRAFKKRLVLKNQWRRSHFFIDYTCSEALHVRTENRFNVETDVYYIVRM